MINGDSETSPSPKKKRKFTIESVKRKDKAKIEPVLATFTNGKPVKDVNLKGYLQQKCRGDDVHKAERIFAVETPWINYVGKNYGQSNIMPVRESIFIGILDKSSGKMRLVETSSYTLHPELALNKKKRKTTHDESYQEKQERIISQFGSKKAKQVLKQRKFNAVNVEGMVGAIQQASTDVKVTKEDLKASVEEENDYLTLLPECDREAKTPEEVYKLEWIAPDFFLANFETEARKHMANEIVVDETYSSLAKEIIAIAKFETDEENQVRLICVGLYVEQLLRFSRLSKYKMRKASDILSDCPNVVKYHILDQYTVGKQRSFSEVDKDRVLCLIIVLTLIGCKYEVFTSTLIESLHINIKKLHLLMRAVGATYINANLSFKLKFPLTKIAKSYKKIKGINGRM